MNNIKPLMKRVVAYTIDVSIVLILSSLISSIPFLNKGMKGYQQTYEEYEEEYNQYADYLKLLEESYKDEQINEEEYNQLIEVVKYQNIISSKYNDNTISEEEYSNIVSEINKEFDLVANDYVYLLAKKGVSNSIITLVCTLLYFGILQYFLKGQTIGKKILKLKVVSASDKKINIFNYLLRSLIINDVFLNSISILFLLLANQKVYTSANNVISTIISLLEASIIFLVLTREDNRGLHDLLFNTKVISTEIKEENLSTSIDNKKVIEAEIEESEEKDITSKKTNNKKSKSDIRSNTKDKTK